MKELEFPLLLTAIALTLFSGACLGISLRDQADHEALKHQGLYKSVNGYEKEFIVIDYVIGILIGSAYICYYCWFR